MVTKCTWSDRNKGQIAVCIQSIENDTCLKFVCWCVSESSRCFIPKSADFSDWNVILVRLERTERVLGNNNRRSFLVYSFSSPTLVPAQVTVQMAIMIRQLSGGRGGGRYYHRRRLSSQSWASAAVCRCCRCCLVDSEREKVARVVGKERHEHTPDNLKCITQPEHRNVQRAGSILLNKIAWLSARARARSLAFESQKKKNKMKPRRTLTPDIEINFITDSLVRSAKYGNFRRFSVAHFSFHRTKYSLQRLSH